MKPSVVISKEHPYNRCAKCGKEPTGARSFEERPILHVECLTCGYMIQIFNHGMWDHYYPRYHNV